MSKVVSCKVVKIDEINPHIKKYTLELSKLVSYEPGQYLQLALDKVSASELWPDSRAFSIASYLDLSMLDIYVKKTGQFTSYIHQIINLNDEISVKLPYGDFTLPLINENTKIVCFSNGVGITPFLSFIDYLSGIKMLKQLYIFHTFRFITDLIGIDKLQKLSISHLNLFLTGSNDGRFINRRLMEVDILKYNFEPTTFFYISGSNDFIHDIEKLLNNLGFTRIFKDQW